MKEELTNAQIADEVDPRLVELLSRTEAQCYPISFALELDSRLTAHNTSPCP